MIFHLTLTPKNVPLNIIVQLVCWNKFSHLFFCIYTYLFSIIFVKSAHFVVFDFGLVIFVAIQYCRDWENQSRMQFLWESHDFNWLLLLKFCHSGSQTKTNYFASHLLWWPGTQPHDCDRNTLHSPGVPPEMKESPQGKSSPLSWVCPSLVRGWPSFFTSLLAF